MIKKILLLVSIISSPICADERAFIEQMSTYVPMTERVKNTLITMASPHEESYMKKSNTIERPLYRQYSLLNETLPHVTLGDLPTPIARLGQLENYFNNNCMIFIKDDGLTGMPLSGGRSFGGNKIRKLEFLFAEALKEGAGSVMTRGGIGSNHVVATAVSAQKLGLRCIAQLTPQEVTDVVKRNMLLMHENSVEMILNPNRDIYTMQVVCSYVQNKYNYGHMPYFIPTGGSCPLGIIGYVNAAFELKEQIDAGLMPEPDYIYVATGSCGTVTGLLLGVRAAGLKTKVIGVAVEPDDPNNPMVCQIMTLLEKTNALLCSRDSSFPSYQWSEADVQLLFDFSGVEYGVGTPQAENAIALLREKENIQLDTTYTGKTCAGMLHEIASGKCDDQIVLFWNTFCSQIADPLVTPDELCPAFRQFFVVS